MRYYLAHFQAIDEGIGAGTEVTAGQRLGELGRSGDAGACHVHFGISPPCPGSEWSVRRGVIWPWPYLDAWRKGEQRSPALEIYAWSHGPPGRVHHGRGRPGRRRVGLSNRCHRQVSAG